MRVQFKLACGDLAAALLCAAPAMAQKSADTLRIAMRDALPNIDPYYNNLRTGVVMHHQAWDTLVYRNPDTFKIEPLLATEWKLPDATTIDFTLRPGVKFHDGSPSPPTTSSTRSTSRPTRTARSRRRRTTAGSTRPRRPAISRCASSSSARPRPRSNISRW